MATALKDHAALFAWEIINEAEGQDSSDRQFKLYIIWSLKNENVFWILSGLKNPDEGLVYNNKSDDEPCFDTTTLQGFQGTTDCIYDKS